MGQQATAIMIGASGSVGTHLVRALSQVGYHKIITLTRQSCGQNLELAKATNVALVEVLLPKMNPSTLLTATLNALEGLDHAVGFSSLGIGAGTAKLKLEEHRAIDVDLNQAFAKALRQSQKVRHLVIMSAAGANSNAAATGYGGAGFSRYNRVKAEAELAVSKDGPPVVSIVRPAMIIGSQHTPSLLSKILPLFNFVVPGKFRSIKIDQLAMAMAKISLMNQGQSQLYHYPELMTVLDQTQLSI